MQAAVYSKEGKEIGKVELPESVFDVPWNADLVHQVVVSMQSNARMPLAHTKDRSEVRGGGRKPWRQKGTGRARHGSRRSPIWTGGGVTFGPRKEKSFAKKINKKMRAKALYTTLSQKLRDKEIIFLDSLAIAEPKTKEAKAVLSALAGVPAFATLSRKKKNAALITIPENDLNTKRSFQNIGSVVVEELRNLNPVDVLSYKYVVVADPKKAIEFLISKRGIKEEAVKMSKETAKAKVSATPTKPARTTAQSGRKVVVKKAPVKRTTTNPARTTVQSGGKTAPKKDARKAVKTK